MRKPLIYLAGPGIFRKDANDYGAKLKLMAAGFHMQALWPLDNEVKGKDSADTARRIRVANLAMIRQCDAVIADLTNFRGPNMDPGTAFEVGYANALNKAIFFWSNDCRTLKQRTAQWHEVDAAGRDENGYLVERFGLVENLMVVTPISPVFRSPQEAMLACANVLMPMRLKAAR